MTPEGYILRQLSVRALQLAPVLALVASTVDLTTTGPFWAERVGWGTVLRGTLLHLPLQLVLVLPLAALLGGALLVAKLARGGELDAWSNSGRTPGRLGSSMTAAGGVLAMGALALMEFVVPACEAACSRLYDHRRPSALGATQQVHRWLLAPGDWIVQLAPAAARERSRWNAFRLSEKHRLAQRLSGTLTHFGAPKTNEITSQPAASALEASESAGLRSLLRSITPTDERLPPEALSTPQLWRRAQQETEQGRSSPCGPADASRPYRLPATQSARRTHSVGDRHSARSKRSVSTASGHTRVDLRSVGRYGLHLAACTRGNPHSGNRRLESACSRPRLGRRGAAAHPSQARTPRSLDRQAFAKPNCPAPASRCRRSPDQSHEG